MQMPKSPWHVPVEARSQNLRHIIDATSSTRATAHDAEETNPPPGPETVAGDGLEGIFRTCWQMPAIIANKTGQSELIEADKAGSKNAAGGLAPWAGVVTRNSRITVRNFHLIPYERKREVAVLIQWLSAKPVLCSRQNSYVYSN
jgi:hypothetical protein